ncbi:hypothetical protein Tco_1461260, partial [Tanacetum coccineum]
MKDLVRINKIHGETISQEDVNQKFFKSLSSEWNTHTIVWWNKLDINTLSLDDLYNNLKIYEPEVKGTSSTNTNTQNVAFVSSNTTSITNRAVNTAHGTTTASTQATTINSTTIDNLSDAAIYGFKVADGYANIEGKEILEEDWKKVFYKWALRNHENKNREPTRRTVPSDQVEEGLTNFALMAYSSTSSSSFTNSEVSNDSNSCSSCLECVKDLKEQNEQLVKDLRTTTISVVSYKTGLEYVEARLNFMPPKPDLVYPSLADFVDVNESVSESIVEKPTVETYEPKTTRKENKAPIIEDWVSESEEEDVPKIKTVEMFNKP